ncbi:hypothetical protein MUS1_08070 [Marinomonas ushuaiensis DSM 15871]|uniref:DUF1499 domain-containing protein n=1 Tax=Marinomonas ushuaiensis DSM 15871 TaxID=1122207 RepID=X7E7K2_9GAMM|nr:DUF1499 domain-containing protein [Marinomonas ushuaiensis]ETX11887.1 hypothetical protein MUS1_08070 [Marinomonas ushuaiensis DSM 15871]
MSRYISPVLYVLLMLVGCVAFISIAGVRVGIFEPLTGFSILRKSVFASLILSVLAILSLGICRKERNIASQRFFILVLTVSVVYSSMWIAFYIQKAGLPRINDVTTDTEMPPAFLNVNFIRMYNENDLAYDYDNAPIQHEHYQDIKPIFTKLKKDDVYKTVSALVEQRGWEVVAKYSQAGLLEATARTPIFGFRDDVIIRVMKVDEDTVRIDMRSCSRIGSGDYGLNAERVEAFMTDLSKSLVRSTMPKVNSAR